MAVAYISTIITIILFIGMIFYHISLLVRKEKLPRELDEYWLVKDQPAKAEVSHSFLEFPEPSDPFPQSEVNCHNMEEIEVHKLTTSDYQ